VCVLYKVLERIETLDTRQHISEALDAAVIVGDIHLVAASSVVCRVVDRIRYGEFVRPFIVDAGPSKVLIS